MNISITGIGSEFQGVGRIEDGRAAFVPGALIGECVQASICKNAERFVECRLEQVISPAPVRIQPACPLSGRCGGCKAQHVEYGAALNLKTQIVRQTVERIGSFTDIEVRPAKGSVSPWRYRNKGEFAISFDKNTRKPIIGSSEANSHRLLDMNDCLIQHELSIRVVDTVRQWMTQRKVPAWDENVRAGGLRYVVTRVNHKDELMVILCTTAKNIPFTAELEQMLKKATGGALRSFYQLLLSPRPHHALDGKCRLISGDATIKDTLMGLTFDISPQTFFQVNREMTDVLYGEALAAAALEGHEEVLDAYCGAGTISLSLAKKAKKVIGVELNAKAIEDAKRNAKANGLSDKTQFIAGDAAEEVLKLFDKGFRPEVMVVDPPRKGVEAKLLNAMVRCKPKRIVYVSCNPSTLARDLKILTQSGEYRVEYVQPVDMFAQTEHIESVVCLTKCATTR